MRTELEIKQIVQQNINQIKISEFVTDGGWPNIEHIDVAVYSQTESNGVEIINLHILYTVDKAGCCFIPGREEQNRMSKTLIIEGNNIKIK
ncbi:hypothetical protein ACXGQW_02270 [Wenyingzhuangia sp. IMCC45533]